MFKKLKEQKGFTLAELLVVVAIIGVLVAISIPIFSGQLEKSRDAVTIANVRSAYAEAQTTYLTESDNGTNVTYNAQEHTVTVKGVVAKGKKAGFSGLEKELPFKDQFTPSCDAMGGTAGTYNLIFTYNDADGTIKTVTAQNQ